MNQHELKSQLERMWEPRKDVPFKDRNLRDNEIANLLCSFMDDYLLTEDEIAPIRERVVALLDEGGYWKEFYK